MSLTTTQLLMERAVNRHRWNWCHYIKRTRITLTHQWCCHAWWTMFYLHIGWWWSDEIRNRCKSVNISAFPLPEVKIFIQVCIRLVDGDIPCSYNVDFIEQLWYWLQLCGDSLKAEFVTCMYFVFFYAITFFIVSFCMTQPLITATFIFIQNYCCACQLQPLSKLLYKNPLEFKDYLCPQIQTVLSTCLIAWECLINCEIVVHYNAIVAWPALAAGPKH